MNRVGSRRWLLAVGALVIVMSLGTVACGSSVEDEVVAGAERRERDGLQAKNYAEGEKAPGVQPGVAERREAARQQSEARAERQKALVERLRDDMSEEDQALFDELKATIANLRTDMQENRRELADTLRQLRELTDKYLSLDNTGEDQ